MNANRFGGNSGEKMTKRYKKNRKSHKLTEEHKRKISRSLKGRHVSPTTEFTKGHKSGTTGKKHSLKTRQKMSKHTGDSRWNYKGGITTLNKRIYYSYKYRQWRSDVFTRDNFTCQKCGKRKLYIEAHHIKGFSEIMTENKITTLEAALNCEELWNINNGLTLCQKCHNLTKRGRPKRKFWRPK